MLIHIDKFEVMSGRRTGKILLFAEDRADALRQAHELALTANPLAIEIKGSIHTGGMRGREVWRLRKKEESTN